MKHLVLGGARSGKSQYAESWVKSREKTCVYIATGWAGDQEMSARIAHHKQQRKGHWHLVEEPLALSKVLLDYNQTHYAVLVDCLTLWLSNALTEHAWQNQKHALFDIINKLSCDVALVSNEVGSGVVPMGYLSRTFVDEAGWLNQALAKQCEWVSLVVAGLPMPLKRAGMKE